MAMMKCRECGSAVSTEAPSCPSCGVPRRMKKKRKGSSASDAIALLVLIPGTIWLVSECQDPGTVAQGPARQESLDRAFSAWDGEHREVARAIQERMNDPTSYEHVETNVYDAGDVLVLTTKVRGTNAFGAVVTETYRDELEPDGSLIRLFE